jgi:hypothetical protein
MPNLKTSNVPEYVNPYVNYLDSLISIQNWGHQPLNVSLPNFWNATQLVIAGNLAK